MPKALLTEPDDEHMRPILPSFEHTQLVVMHVDMMRFRGLERDKAGVGYEQEWMVRVFPAGAPSVDAAEQPKSLTAG